MIDNVHETIKAIKAKCRLYMNGVVSQSMREKGLDYKLNFGIEYPRIKEIASAYEPDHDLAQALWKENVRECKIMAGLLQPVETFYPEIAEIWIEDMRYPELAEYTVMNLFQHLSYASDVVFCWIADEREMFQLCGFLLMMRLFIKGNVLNEQAASEFLDQAFTAVEGDSLSVRKAAMGALMKYAAQCRENKKKTIKMLTPFYESGKTELISLADVIKNGIEC